MNSFEDDRSEQTADAIYRTKDEALMADTWRQVQDAELNLYHARRRNHAADRSLRVAEDLYFLNPDPSLSDIAEIEVARKELAESITFYREANAAVKTSRKLYSQGVELFRAQHGRKPDIHNYVDRLPDR